MYSPLEIIPNCSSGKSVQRYFCEFAVINCSDLCTIEWSTVLYRSFLRFSDSATPFYIILPEKDLPQFERSFDRDFLKNNIAKKPTFLSEEWLLDKSGVKEPNHFEKYRRRQILRLCFSKLGFARQYLSLESSIVFTKKFNYKSFLYRNQIFTGAKFIEKTQFFDLLNEDKNKHFCRDVVPDIANRFLELFKIMKNNTNYANCYHSCTGMINSDIARSLELFSYDLGLDGYIGLIEKLPCDLSWYGEYVFVHHPTLFYGYRPDLMRFVSSTSEVDQCLLDKIQAEDGYFGIYFRSNETHDIDPEEFYYKI